MKSIKTNLYFKLGTIILIGILMLIPASMIESLINERELIHTEAIREVSSKWGDEQTVCGPFISIPYYRYVQSGTDKNQELNMIKVKDFIHLLPKQLNIEGEISPERRYRGIYEIVVYQAKLQISGSFDQTRFAELDIQPEDIQFDKAVFTVGLNDLRGIENEIMLDFNASDFSFNPGVLSNDVVGSGIHALVGLNPTENTSLNFSFNLDIKGSQKLYFTPLGKTNHVSVTSVWSNPSFNGAFLPDSRIVSNNGFKAEWDVLHLNRNYPQQWTGNSYAVSESSFGVDLLLPVDNYQKSHRTTRYAILFIAFTFLVFFFIEVLKSVFIHPVQYILVGIALIVFFTLLLSLSEYLPFNMAYIVSVIATLSLVAAYVKAILKNNRLTGLITGILFILYSFIFVILQLQDFALLIGSIGIFIILALVMYFSRKIDWYHLNDNVKDEIM
ncbi:MAG: cell envelope integrity protein CreD [Bacteroidetes bacterium HGW-Bacteroidetes-1]|jgi:inner membrane protein|nr:MAG: cell envelope integrity protein CreD [Bacteroidetes bacterium HGW-Bacteroidetes-1]